MHGYDGDTGAVIYAGGGANELMSGTRQWNTGMVARGRIYFGADNKVYAFRLPAAQRPRLHLQPQRQLQLQHLLQHTYGDLPERRYGHVHAYRDYQQHATFTPTATATATATATLQPQLQPRLQLRQRPTATVRRLLLQRLSYADSHSRGYTCSSEGS